MSITIKINNYVHERNNQPFDVACINTSRLFNFTGRIAAFRQAGGQNEC